MAVVSETGARVVGHPWSFPLALLVLGAWILVGVLIGYSDRWLLLLNSVATLAAALTIFLLQHTQNRDTAALHLKLNELVAATKGASNRLVEAERLEPEALEDLARHHRPSFRSGRARVRHRRTRRRVAKKSRPGR